ncbi:MAG: SURF1 family protein [Pseudomonadota bacterium]
MERVIPVISALLFIGLFTRLGFWQLDREQEKRALFEGFAVAMEQPPRPLDPYAPQPRFSRVSLTGMFTGEQFFLDNQILDGQPGVHVYAPFALDSIASTILVNRGWLPMDRTRRSLPALPPVPEGLTTVAGHLYSYPQPGIKVGEPNYEAPTPWLLVYFEPEKLADALGQELTPQILLATDADPAPLVQLWEPRVMAPEKHRGYAIQWFSLAGAVVIVTLILLLRMKKTISRS